MVALFKEFLGTEESGGSASGTTFSSSKAQPYHYVVRDTEQKGLCLQDGHLVAITLQGANAAQEEPISVVPNRHLELARCPLILGIRGGTQALSCGTGPQPQLQLKEVKLLDLFHREVEETTPYTFYKTYGGTTHTFEAAAFPGHFLSTAPGSGEPLALSPPPAATAFYLAPAQETLSPGKGAAPVGGGGSTPGRGGAAPVGGGGSTRGGGRQAPVGGGGSTRGWGEHPWGAGGGLCTE
ncbi:LOW QUALITY PROTEIN: interleukin-36 receptor antagonist protein-like [Heliangelus exortis]|uniref:LOW QUALITY PROTEIN: interleukin-36 receptor antagonist protein-like n=1 Tax=Heliangelus exortis TaxID=472823 RepID=UPI003A90A647